ncbi:two-component system sensor histidine kinase CreC [Undibacterium sp. RTI2.1]|uniref:two-component system sensor histidine kinase CreC n=1 Tax=unclassified Undibacterium TaxID=2630295 RepID=UPI002AB47DB5|nr:MULTISPECIES: two-component system sensor histidine kinase CreC [unclassified Undibacterium]MDY7539781.1 two-component system sensor histidine kinase CreC [Undibacterium sp. 5I1]MEB0029433.1 two-component system sensor histidine kinase CreC [Undibacterium sp. RTI2.1]MEB0115948.1 two-component system sensor histidine kinase CreC [Undibacterium sp. RTI2.2]MEB0232037.1 two-component system sensor histidine kinase CreC [Undibacterium sp. 10I3]MEB0256816.1 two-component system sensor histidine k
MKIGLRILFGYFLVVGLAAWFVLNVFVEEVKPGVRATLEDTLVDTAQLLAQLVAEDVKAGDLPHAALIGRLQNHVHRSVDVNISGVQKATLDYRIYITDIHGIVVFDSDNKDVGKDYSRWNDVYLTLQGKYGARNTLADPADNNSNVMHVAAPILDGGRIIGALTVAKPISTITPFIERSQRKILRRSGWLILGSLLIGIGFSFWLSHSLRTLQRYASSVENDEKVSLPKLGDNEIGALGRALESMRNKLEGKQYVEQLMHTLAHELKSPIAAIQGSAELLTETMPEADRQHFLRNIIEQNQRQKQLIDKLLALIKIEKQQILDSVSKIDLPDLITQVQADASTRLTEKLLQLRLDVPAITVMGDALLLRQAIGNLLDNAIAFSPSGSTIIIDVSQQKETIQIQVKDHGAGIPDYAMARIFERFYSLERPDAAKSTGLGLPFVREVALLHGGSVTVSNRTDGGVCACLSFPDQYLH